MYLRAILAAVVAVGLTTPATAMSKLKRFGENLNRGIPFRP